MHDVMFSKEIVAAVNAKKQSLPQNTKVVGIHVLLSPLSHVTGKGLGETFAMMVEGTDLEKVAFLVKPMKIPMSCASCGATFWVDAPTFACTQCGNAAIAVTDSREFVVESIDVEEA